MKNVKRVLAIICAVILLGMYIATFVLSILDRSETMAMFKGCVALTIFVPVAAYLYLCLHRYAMWRSKRNDPYSKDALLQSDIDGSDDKQEKPQ